MKNLDDIRSIVEPMFRDLTRDHVPGKLVQGAIDPRTYFLMHETLARVCEAVELTVPCAPGWRITQHARLNPDDLAAIARHARAADAADAWAIRLRAAYVAAHRGIEGLASWSQLAEDEREAWRAVARVVAGMGLARDPETARKPVEDGEVPT